MHLIYYVWLVLFWGWNASELALLLVTRTRRGGGELRDRGSLLILWPTIIASITLGYWYGGIHGHTIFPGALWVGNAAVCLLVAGLVIRWTAIVTLGRSFSVNVAIHATQTVQRSGIFRFARHPSYTGLVIIFLAVGVSTGNWVGLLIVLVPSMCALLYRIHVEETALTRAFGQQYVDYSRETRRLIPGLF